MSITELLELARAIVLQQDGARSIVLANAVIALLSADYPQLLAGPPVVSCGDGTRGVLLDEGVSSQPLEPFLARAYAVAVLRSADEAEV